jgi:Fe-S cluster biogenesis protein NfuA
MTREEEEKKISEEVNKTIAENEMPEPKMAKDLEEQRAAAKEEAAADSNKTAMQNAEGTPERKELMDRIQHTINKIRPYIQADGGDVQLMDYKDGVVTVSMVGACAGCMVASQDVSQGIQAIIIDEIPEVHKVQMLETNPWGYSQF